MSWTQRFFSSKIASFVVINRVFSVSDFSYTLRVYYTYYNMHVLHKKKKTAKFFIFFSFNEKPSRHRLLCIVHTSLYILCARLWPVYCASSCVLLILPSLLWLPMMLQCCWFPCQKNKKIKNRLISRFSFLLSTHWRLRVIVNERASLCASRTRRNVRLFKTLKSYISFI